MITEQGKVHYLLVRGYEEFHDGDEWLGIYSSWENAIAAYEREHAALEREKARDLETFGEQAMLNNPERSPSPVRFMEITVPF